MPHYAPWPADHSSPSFGHNQMMAKTSAETCPYQLVMAVPLIIIWDVPTEHSVPPLPSPPSGPWIVTSVSQWRQPALLHQRLAQLRAPPCHCLTGASTLRAHDEHLPAPGALEPMCVLLEGDEKKPKKCTPTCPAKAPADHSDQHAPLPQPPPSSPSPKKGHAQCFLPYRQGH